MGERPMSQMTKPAIRKAVMKAATGASARMTGDTVGRGVSSNRMNASLDLGDAEHFEADRLPGPFADRFQRAQLALMDDGHPVRHLEQLVEILTDDHNGTARAGEIDERLADEPRRARIDAPGRLVDHDELRLAD